MAIHQAGLADDAVWVVVESVAAALLADGTVEGETLRQVLSPLAEKSGRH
jgi:hypothetical protein